MELKRGKYFNTIHYDIDETNKVVTFKKEVFEEIIKQNLYKKEVGGSSLGDVLETTSFSSPFNTWMNMFSMRLPIIDDKYIKAGIALEPKVIEKIEKQLNEEIETWSDLSKQVEWKITNRGSIGGRPDGFIKSKDLIIEIKTAKEEKKELWDKGQIPMGYLRQAQLYAYLMGVKKFSIVALFLKEEDYQNPESLDISERKTSNYNRLVNESLAKDDIEYINNWYRRYVLNGTSPLFDDSKNQDQLNWLRCKTAEERKELEEQMLNRGK